MNKLNYIFFSLFLSSQIYQLAKDTIVLLLECNPDIGMLLEWVIDRCYTAIPREADACFLALSSIFNAKWVENISIWFNDLS